MTSLAGSYAHAFYVAAGKCCGSCNKHSRLVASGKLLVFSVMAVVIPLMHLLNAYYAICCKPSTDITVGFKKTFLAVKFIEKFRMKPTFLEFFKMLFIVLVNS
jgi:hypothetical protein